MDYCRLNQITIQAWSPFQIDLNQGTFFGKAAYQQLNDTLNDYAGRYQVSPEAIVTAWILRHPAKIQTVVGSMNPERISKIAEAEKVMLSRPEWYEIYQRAGHSLP